MTTTKIKKKKSPREKRVLIASIILAAAIVAGSTFAWFSSVDEVTNRLTSTADYGVSIVESFTPPVNWIPGQDVNKDVYATNTGNIDAFVEEEISGKLTVTFENKVGSFGITGVDYVEITGDEKTAIEAGGYLIWTDTNEALGEKDVLTTGGWAPNESGFYVFRRAIEPNNVAQTTAEKYDIEGYYYDNGTQKYYKIAVNTNSTTTDAGTGKVTSGVRTPVDTMIDPVTGLRVLASDPNISFVTLKTVTVDQVGLTYHDADTTTFTQPYLVAEYTVPTTDTTAQQATDNTNIANAQADVDAATALIALSEAQIKAINDVQAAAQNAKVKAHTYLQYLEDRNTATTGTNAEAVTAGVAVKTKADNYNTEIDPTKIIAPAVSLTEAQINASTADATQRTQLNTYRNALVNAHTTFGLKYTAFTDAVDEFTDTDYTTAEVTAATATASRATMKTAYDELIDAWNALKNAYGNVEAYADQYGLQSGLYLETTNPYDSGDFATEMVKLQTYYGDLDGLVGTYITKATTNETNASNLNSAWNEYSQAIDDYNSTLTSADTAYSSAVADYTTDREKSYDIKNSIPADFDAITNDYKLAVGAVVTTTMDDAAKQASAEAAYGYAKSAVVAASYRPEVTGLRNHDTSVSKFLETVGADKKVLVLGADSTTDNSLKKALATAQDDLKTANDIAEGHQTQAAAGATNNIKINIVLSNQVSTDGTKAWKHMPAATNAESAKFYLTSLLGAGATSEKLVDYVQLDDSVNGSYVDLVFDLDVKLSSAQVTYDDNNNVTTTAASNNFTGVTVAYDSATGKVSWN